MAAAGVITIVLSAITAVLFAFVAVSAARDDSAVPAPGAATAEDPTALPAPALLAISVVLVIWSVVAVALGVLTMRGHGRARIGLVISASVAALLGLLAIVTLISLVTFGAGVAVVILLFTGGANEWFAARELPQGEPGDPRRKPPAQLP